MGSRQVTLAATAIILVMLAAAAPAQAALDVTRDATSGAIRVATTADAVEDVTIERTAGGLRVRDANAATTSSDGTCSADAEQPTAISCTAASGSALTVVLGAGADRLDARLATGVALVVSGGAGIDTLRLGSTGTTRVTDTTATDVLDLAHADGAVRVRYSGTLRRLVAACASCSTGSWSVVLLGTGPDDVILGAWPTRGITTWMLGAGEDRFFGARFHRSVVDAGISEDILVSYAPADTLRGGAGMDRIADLGGRGDILAGGAGTDAMSSRDGQRDSIDGGAGRDMCMSDSRHTPGCDTGPVRSFEMSIFLPVAPARYVFAGLGIR